MCVRMCVCVFFAGAGVIGVKGPWDILAPRALTEPAGTYVPDFTARRKSVSVRCLQISQVGCTVVRHAASWHLTLVVPCVIDGVECVPSWPGLGAVGPARLRH
jgi:hypothetical protein